MKWNCLLSSIRKYPFAYEKGINCRKIAPASALTTWFLRCFAPSPKAQKKRLWKCIPHSNEKVFVFCVKTCSVKRIFRFVSRPNGNGKPQTRFEWTQARTESEKPKNEKAKKYTISICRRSSRRIFKNILEISIYCIQFIILSYFHDSAPFWMMREKENIHFTELKLTNTWWELQTMLGKIDRRKTRKM